MSQTHSGHRARVKERLEHEGLANFAAHEVLELLLFYAIPLRNVNPIAHDLIKRFGSLENVLRAPIEQLTQVPSVGESTARWLTSLAPLIDEYNKQRIIDRPLLNTPVKALDFAQRLFEHAPGEQLWAVSTNLMGRLLYSTMLASGNGLARLEPRTVLDFALRYRAQNVILLQNRREATLEPKAADIRFIERLEAMLSAIGIMLMDNLMISGQRTVSMRKKGIIKCDGSTLGLKEPQFDALAAQWMAGEAEP